MFIINLRLFCLNLLLKKYRIYRSLYSKLCVCVFKEYKIYLSCLCINFEFQPAVRLILANVVSKTYYLVESSAVLVT